MIGLQRMSQFDVNLAAAWSKVEGILQGAVALLPNFVIAVVVFTILVLVARIASSLVRHAIVSRGRANLGQVLGKLVFWASLIVAAAISTTIVVPSLRAGDLIAGLGIGSVAIGFAFKDILQNLLAGVLILIRQPFRVGDQIEVEGYEGTVERIETRATMLKTYDGQRVVIPNSDIYTEAVTVRTAFDERRSEYDIGIGYGDDIAEAKRHIMKAVKSIDGVAKEPEPEVLPWDLAPSWVTLRARWWTDPRTSNRVHVHAGVIESVKAALDEAGIDMPFETQVQLFHDQTEEIDGDRDGQREGWPAGDKPPKPRWRAAAASNSRKKTTARNSAA